jgi:hypothetical protein
VLPPLGLGWSICLEHTTDCENTPPALQTHHRVCKLRSHRNRRLTYLQQLVHEGVYFSDEEMSRRRPELYEEYVSGSARHACFNKLPAQYCCRSDAPAPAPALELRLHLSCACT